MRAFLSDVEDDGSVGGGGSLLATLADLSMHDRILLTSHLAAHTRQAVEAMASVVYRQVRASMPGAVPRGLVIGADEIEMGAGRCAGDRRSS